MTIFFQIIPNQHTIRPKQQQTFPHKNLKNNQKKQKRAEDTHSVIPRDVEDEIDTSDSELAKQTSYAVGSTHQTTPK